MSKTCYMGGILQHKIYEKTGYGFKITFRTNKEAKKYKEQIKYIIEVDGYDIKDKKGYYDRKF